VVDGLKEKLFATLASSNNLINANVLFSFLRSFLPDYQAKELICFLLNTRFEDFEKNRGEVLKISEKERLILERVSDGYPVSYITKSRNFYGYDFYVDERVLIPRHETEILVEQALRCIKKDSHILDLCTGSGAILLTLLLETNCSYGLGVDISYKALEVAKINRSKFNMENRSDFLCMDVNRIEALNLRYFDIITCNPPYVSFVESLEKSVLFEPAAALFAEDGGLFFYKKLLRILSNSCKENTIVFFEIGKGLSQELSEIFKSKDIRFIKDYNGVDRVLVWINS
jgi:release factor glutamine methyltransferase